MMHDTLKAHVSEGFLTSILVFLLFVTINSTFAEIVNATDTSRINELYHEGKLLHYTNPDSAIYYYQLVISDYHAIQPEIESDQMTDIAISYLKKVIQALNQSGNIYYYDDQYKRSETYYQQSLNIAEQAGLTDICKRKPCMTSGILGIPITIIRLPSNYSEHPIRNMLMINKTEGMYCTLNASGFV